MLSYGYKYGEPWGEGKRALEEAFREADRGYSRSESARSASKSAQESRSYTRESHHGYERQQSSGGMEVMRVGNHSRDGSRSYAGSNPPAAGRAFASSPRDIYNYGSRAPTGSEWEGSSTRGSVYSPSTHSGWGSAHGQYRGHSNPEGYPGGSSQVDRYHPRELYEHPATNAYAYEDSPTELSDYDSENSSNRDSQSDYSEHRSTGYAESALYDEETGSYLSVSSDGGSYDSRSNDEYSSSDGYSEGPDSEGSFEDDEDDDDYDDYE